MNSSQRELSRAAEAARQAAWQLASKDASHRTAVLEKLAERLIQNQDDILQKNLLDQQAADQAGLQGPLRDRLLLDEKKLMVLGQGVAQLAEWPDPVGRVKRRMELDHGLVLDQVQSPLGVVLVIFESRPDAVIQIGALALRSGNAVILKGGSEALHSNRILIDQLRGALSDAGLSAEAVCGIEGREAVQALLQMDHLVDLVIPRGSNELVRSIQNSTRIPVLGHADGICHLYIDAEADLQMAIRLAIDSKCDYPAACNAVETLLVHRDFLPQMPALCKALLQAKVALRADGAVRQQVPQASEATEQDWSTEYGDLILSIKTVSSMGEAIDHIHRYGSGHTDSIVSENGQTAERFLRQVDSASVFHNASTRFADGYRYGLGAEVGISTSRIHARGPVGVDGLMTTRWLLRGSGQVAADYGPDKRAFTHQALDPECSDRHS
jgi:glutamate-5-semialdehyde dehydrogenase